MPLFWVSLSFLGGIILGDVFSIPLKVYLGLVVVFICGVIVYYGIKHRFRLSIPSAIRFFPVPLWLILFSILFGAFRYQLAHPAITPQDIAWYNDDGITYVLEGVIVKPPVAKESYSRIQVKMERFRPVNEFLFSDVNGLLMVYSASSENFRYGDRIRLQGKLLTPPGGDDNFFKEYLARNQIYSYMPHAKIWFLQHNQGNALLTTTYWMRERAQSVIYQIFPDPQASLIAGILLGIESGIPNDVKAAFVDTGTAHIIAISGFNINIIVALVAGLLGAILGKRRGAVAAALAIGVYAVLVGASAAVVRAAIMGGLSIFAAQIGRKQDGLNTLAFVAALMALANPNVLWDVGFQLSFMATLGLILYVGPLLEIFRNFAGTWLQKDTIEKFEGPVSEFILFTLAAQVTTLPVLIYHFKQLSLISLLANPIILPIQAPLMVLSGAAVILGLIWLPLGRLLGVVALPFATLTIRVVELLAGIPGGVLRFGQISVLVVVLYYVVLFVWTFYGGQLKEKFSKWNGRLILKNDIIYFGLLLVLLGSAFVVWNAALSAPDGKLHLVMFDASSSSQTGDGLLIQSPMGRYVLIDGGVSANRLSGALGRWLPYTNRKIDYLVVAGSSDAQIAGLPSTIERFLPSKVLWSGAPAGSYAARRLHMILADHQIPVINAQEGQVLDLGDGSTLQVVGTSKRGSVLLLKRDSFRVLLPIGLDFDLMDRLAHSDIAGNVTALLLADGGFAPLNTQAWIDRWQPELILLSVAPGDKDGLPDKQTLQAVAGYSILRTDLNGWIHLTTDGETLWVETQK